MGARALGRLWALACLACAVASAGVAQPAPSVELHYEAFEGCPEREAFAQNLEARRRGAATSRAVRLDVRLSRTEAQRESQRVTGSIVVSSGSGVPSARRIVAATCGEAADALALIAALALQGIEVEEVPARDTSTDQDRRGERRADRSPAEGERTAEQPSPTHAAAGVEPSATTESASEPLMDTERESATEDEVIEARPIDERAGAKLDAPLNDESSGDAPVEAAPGTSRAYVLLSGGVATGVLPALQPLPELALSWEDGARGFPSWSVHAAFRMSPEQTRHFDQGVVAFGWWTGLSALCLGARGAQLSASACAALEVGALSSGASETDNPRTKRRAWVALGPGATLAYDITEVLRVSLRAELLTPLARYRLELPRGTAVHEPSALGLRAELGVGLRMW